MTVVVSYLPYPVVAGFLGSIGGPTVGHLMWKKPNKKPPPESPEMGVTKHCRQKVGFSVVSHIKPSRKIIVLNDISEGTSNVGVRNQTHLGVSP